MACVLFYVHNYLFSVNPKGVRREAAFHAVKKYTNY